VELEGSATLAITDESPGGVPPRRLLERLTPIADPASRRVGANSDIWPYVVCRWWQADNNSVVGYMVGD